MTAFTLAVLLLLATPGPGVLSTAGVGAGYGFRAGLRYVAGLFVGNNLVALAVVSGVAAFVLSVPIARPLLVGASIAYLLYLAARIAFAGRKLAFIEARRPPGFAGGLALQPINPKAYVVSTALFSGFPFWPHDLGAEIVAKFLVMNAVWVPVHLGWLFAGAILHRLDLPDRVHFAINIVMALSMLAVVAIAALATFS